MEKQKIKDGIERYLKVKHGIKLNDAQDYEIFNAVSLTILEEIIDDWNATSESIIREEWHIIYQQNF